MKNKGEPVVIPTPDGARLVGQLVGAPHAGTAVVLHGATGVPAGYYAAFAAWLAATHDASVLTYDYRDFGASATKADSVRTSRATMREWGVVDQSAALDWVCGRFPNARVWAVGHSLGGMCVPFHAQAARIERLVAVASGPAHWRLQPWRFLPQVVLLWWLLGPAATWLLGYMPGRRLGLGTDVPGGVYWQWRRWCTSAGFYRRDWDSALPAPDLQRFRGKLTLVAIADDVMIPPACVRALAEFYPAAQVEHRIIEPHSIGAKGIGHVRAFHPRNAAAWPPLFQV